MNIFRKFKKKITKEQINNKIKRFVSRFGENKDIKKIKQEELKDQFYDILFNINLISDKKEKEELIAKAKKIASKIPELKGWPKESKKFWDIEAYAWLGQIPRKIRELIKTELMKRIPPGGLNLSLGSGSYPYIEYSVLLDLSREMLKSVPAVKYKAKIEYDLEKGKLPFNDDSFDTITMVFVIDYLENLKSVFDEIKRILKTNGKLILVQSEKPINELYRSQEVKHLDKNEIKSLLREAGFKVKIKEKKIDKIVLLFVEGVK
jgi:hypothetical protein